jgi:hypothetical protein
VCLAARLRIREKCQERIVNGKEGHTRAWPEIEGICSYCFPDEAAAEEKRKMEGERKKQAVEQKKEDEADTTSHPALVEPALESFPFASDFEVTERYGE